MNILLKVQKLLKSDMSGYRIAKESGISQTQIQNLISGKRRVEGLSIENAEKLADVYDKHMLEIATKNNDPRLIEREKLVARIAEIDKSLRDK